MPVALEPQFFDQVEEALKDVMDPELGVNIVDLGLVYDLTWDDDTTGPAFYYVRVFGVDGETAWSSPIWIDSPLEGHA